MVNFPIQIITNILCRLDIKTLLEYKLVCKEWLCLIRSTYFGNLVTQQHSLSSTINPNRTLIVIDRNFNLYSINLDSSSDTPARRLRVNTTNLFKNRGIAFIGSCNGIICLRDITPYHYSIIFLNPLTNRCKVVDVSGIEEYRYSWCGFGYNSYEHDHKIVLISTYTQSKNNRIEVIWRTSVYSLRTNTCTAVPNDGFPQSGFYGCNLDKGLLIGSHLVHWKSSSSISERVSCFNFCDNKWSDVPLPFDIARIKKNRWMVVGVLDGCLSLLFTRHRQIEDGSELWIMKEYGVAESWVRLFDVSNLSVASAIFNIVACSMDGEEILVHIKFSDQPMFWYNPRTKTKREGPFDGIPIYSQHLMFSEGLATIPDDVQIGVKDN